MVDSADDLQPEWFEGKRRVGLTAGASAPEVLVQQVIERLRALGAVSVRSLAGVAETVHFPLPMGLGDKSMRRVPTSAPSRAASAAPAVLGAQRADRRCS